MNAQAGTTLPISMLIPAGKILLLGAFGSRLVLSFRRQELIAEAFLALIVGYLAIAFYQPIASGLLDLMGELNQALGHLDDPNGLKELILDAMRRAAAEPGSGGASIGVNAPALFEQIFRTGVWGIIASVTQFFFLLSDLFLEVSRTVLWQISLFLFPLAAGISPVFPETLSALSRYLIEISLWQPLLTLVRVATTLAARRYMLMQGSWGLYCIAVELFAIYITLKVPGFTRQIVTGAFHPSGPSESLGLIAAARRVVLGAGGGA